MARLKPYPDIGRKSTQSRGAGLQFSAGGPFHLPSTEYVDVKMGDGLAAMPAVVDHDAKAVIQRQTLGYLAGHKQQVTHEALIVASCFPDAGDWFLGYDKDVCGSLRINVAYREAEIVFVFKIAWYFSVGDFLEQGLFRRHWFV